MRRYAVWAMASMLAVGNATAQADSASAWPVGSRVRVSTHANRPVVGQLSEVRGDTLVIRRGRGLIRPRTRVLADSSISLEVSREQSISAQRVAAGGLLGALAAVVLTAALSEAMGDVCLLGECSERDTDYARAAAVGAAGGAVGALFMPVDRWETVRAPVGFRLGGDGLRVAFSVKLPPR